MSTIYTVYKAVNLINGKCYIGFDSNWPNRKYHHVWAKEQYPIQKAIKKYGKQNFKWEVLYQSKDAEHTLSIMEPYFIKENNSFGKNGYNMTKGGDGVLGLKHTEKTKRKISISSKGRKRPQIEIDKIRLALLGSQRAAKSYKFSRDGKTIEIFNLKKYCRTNGIPYQGMWELSKGIRKTFRGFS